MRQRLLERVRYTDPAEAESEKFCWFRQHLFVRTVDERLVPFVPNPVQAEFDIDRTGRDIVDKARKEGISTYVLADFYRHITTTSNSTALVVAHRPDSTQALWEIIQCFYEHDPRRLRLKYASKNELYFDELNSRFIVGTVGQGAGRGRTINRLHVSELAWWPGDAKSTLGGMIAAVPSDGNAEVVIESTAHGEGGEFHRRWRIAVEGNAPGRHSFTAHFFPWFAHAGYREPWVDGEQTPLVAEERTLVDAHGIDLEQIAFRRWGMDEYGPDLFKQEYPATWQESFRASGRKVFDYDALERMEARFLLKPIRHQQWGDAYLKIWSPPQIGHRYVAGADTAEGIAGGDAQDVRLYDFDDLREVACLHGRWPIHVFARKLTALIKPYGALCAVERNNHGHAVLEHLVRGEDAVRMPFHLLYRHKGYDDKGKAIRKVGWPTDVKTKPIMIADLEDAIRREQLEPRDTLFYGEARAFEYTEEGKMQAPEGSHDDSIISTALVLQARKRMNAPSAVGSRSFPGT
jgi:hypothetical protein